MPSRSIHLVDPELISVLDPYPSIHQPPPDLNTLRAELKGALAGLPIRTDLPVDRTEVWLSCANRAAVRALVYRPRAGGGVKPAVLHIHGGGFVIGSPEFADPSNQQLAADLDCVVVSIDYRLAPEHSHPAPVEDGWTALNALYDQADAFGIDRDRIGVKGESAGGGLAAALAILARDRGGPTLAFQHLNHPMLDDRTCVHPDPHPYTGEFVWNAARNNFGWSALLGHAPGIPDVSPHAAPARASDFSGLPPAFLSIGALDLFLEESMEYARRLTRAGVPVELHVYPGAFHGSGAAAEARVSRAAARDSRDSLRRAIYG